MKRFVFGALLAVAVPAIAQAQSYEDAYARLVPPPVGARQGGGINPYGQYNQPQQYQPPPTYYAPAPPVYYAPPPAPLYAPPATGYGEISPATGLPRTNYVNGYTRSDGTYVAPYYRSRR